MKPTRIRSTIWRTLLVASLAVSVNVARADGIPEPSLVIYGVVNNLGAGGARMSFGTLTWVFQPTAGGTPITFNTTLTNINDQFSYVLRIPCETELSGIPISGGTLKLAASASTYDRSQVTIAGAAAAFAVPAQTTLVLAPTDRGRIERVDLTVNLVVETFAQWLARYGLPPNSDPNSDPLHKGMTLAQEFAAGTNPNDPHSLFEFISVAKDTPSGVQVEWSSVQGKLYTVQRSGALLTGFGDLQTHVAATAPMNTFHDATATGTGPYFYRLLVEP